MHFIYFGVEMVMRIFIIFSLIFGVNVANATSAACVFRPFPSSQLLNVSSSGWATKDEPVVACTVVNPDIADSSGIVFLSETATEDAYLEIRYVDQPSFRVRIADNWKEEMPEPHRYLLPLVLRAPGKETDAAIIMHSDPSYYKPTGADARMAVNRFGVCALGYPKNGRAWTSVSLSTYQRSGCPADTPSPVNYFQR